jgi:hypothetical protein
MTISTEICNLCGEKISAHGYQLRFRVREHFRNAHIEAEKEITELEKEIDKINVKERSLIKRLVRNGWLYINGRF